MPSPISFKPTNATLRRSRTAALAIALLAIATTASAAKVYRCGNAFQDQPCPEVKIASATPAERTPPIARDVPCATRDGNGRVECAPKVPAPRDVVADIRR